MTSIRGKAKGGRDRFTAEELQQIRDRLGRDAQVTRGYGDGTATYGAQINRPVPYQVQVKPNVDIPKWSVFSYNPSGGVGETSSGLPRMRARKIQSGLGSHLLLTNDWTPLKADKYGTARVVTEFAPLLVRGLEGQEPTIGGLCGPKVDEFVFDYNHGGFICVDKFTLAGTELYHVWPLRSGTWWWARVEVLSGGAGVWSGLGPHKATLQLTNALTHALTDSQVVSCYCPPITANEWDNGTQCKVEVDPITFEYHITAILECPNPVSEE